MATFVVYLILAELFIGGILLFAVFCSVVAHTAKFVKMLAVSELGRIPNEEPKPVILTDKDILLRPF